MEIPQNEGTNAVEKLCEKLLKDIQEKGWAEAYWTETTQGIAEAAAREFVKKGYHAKTESVCGRGWRNVYIGKDPVSESSGRMVSSRILG